MEKIIFLALSFISGVIELGVVWYGLMTEGNLLTSLLLVLAYQLGNLAFVKKGKANQRAIGVACIGVLALASHVIYWGNPCLNLICNCAAVFAASLALQSARDRVKGRCSTGVKRLSRIVGFLVSPIMSIAPYVVVLVAIVFSSMILCTQGIHVELARGKKMKIIPAMVFHQMHYFVYTYVILGWLLNRMNTIGVNRNEWILAGGFAITWLIYMMPEVINRYREDTNYIMHFILGHVFLLFVMVLATVFASLNLGILVIILWALTGIGGGTVYAIPELTTKYRMTDMKFSEDLGHVSGVLIAIAVYLIYGMTYGIGVFMGLSATFVAITLILAVRDIRKERNK